jgi:hypothetical protein
MNSITFPCVGKESYQLTSQLKVREIFSFAPRHIFPNLRLAEVTTELYYAWAFPLDDKLKLFSFLWSSKYQEHVPRLTYEARLLIRQD